MSALHTMELLESDELQESGLLWLLNRTLHPFGVAIAVAVIQDDETGEQETLPALRAFRTTDPLGLVFSEESENECREKFFRWAAAELPRRLEALADPGEPGPSEGGGSGTGGPMSPRPDDEV